MNKQKSTTKPDFVWLDMVDLLVDPSQFFAQFLAQTRRLCQADAALLVVQSKIAASDPKSGPMIRLPGEQESEITVLSHDLPTEKSAAAAQLVVLFREPSKAKIETAETLLPLLSTVPGWLEKERRLTRAEEDLGQFASVLDLTVLLHSVERFQAAAMLLSNELATRYRCHRVSLGWLEGNDIKIRSISHTDKLETRMESLQQLAAVMEESIDQGVEIVYPGKGDRFAVARAHRKFAEEQRLSHIVTLPLLRPITTDTESADDAESDRVPIAGAITMECDSGSFSDQQMRSLRLVCEQITPRLIELQKSDGWFGRRAVRACRAGLGKLVGVDHTWVKLLSVALAVTFAVLLFGKKEFRVRAPFTVETDSVVYLSAPFSGYLGEASFREGDEVGEGIPIFALDTSELLLEKQQALAESTRHRAEATRAEANGEVAGMRISKAQLKQAEARLDLVQFQLDHAAVSAPFDGVVVEGNLTEKVDAPVEKGDVLVKLAKISGLFPELKIDESDIRYAQPGAIGSVAFAARPDTSFEIELERIEPAARSDETGNTFTVRCRFIGENDDDLYHEWWRPGMTGVAKIDCGQRSLLWIFTRHTVDRIRLFFW